MRNPAVFIREPLKFKKEINIYPPSVREVICNQHYSQYLKLLTVSQEDLEDEYNQKKENKDNIPTPFEFLLINCYHNPTFCQVAKEAFEFFIHKPINFFYEEKMIVVGQLEKEIVKINNLDDLVVIREEEYFDFQNFIREVNGLALAERPAPPNPNEDPRITAMKAKARARDRIKAKQAGRGGISLHTCLVAICCMGMGITPLNIGEMSYAAIGPIMKMSQEREKYDIDIRSLLAGADSKKIKPKYWIRNSDKE